MLVKLFNWLINNSFTVITKLTVSLIITWKSHYEKVVETQCMVMVPIFHLNDKDHKSKQIQK